MEKFTQVSAVAAPLMKPNIDTDAIIPVKRLIGYQRHELGAFALEPYRFRADGSENPDFVLNQPRYQGASILLARKNFGCGSSREHAPWALGQYGFRCVIAPSYADIFFNNCFKNGLLPIQLPEATVAQLFDEVLAFPGYQLTIDLERQVIVRPQGQEIAFEVQAFRKYCLLGGLDDIGLTLRQSDKIKAFEAERLATKPWLAHSMVS